MQSKSNAPKKYGLLTHRIIDRFRLLRWRTSQVTPSKFKEGCHRFIAALTAILMLVQPAMLRAEDVPPDINVQTNSNGDYVISINLDPIIQDLTGVSYSSLNSAQIAAADDLMAELNAVGLSQFIASHPIAGYAAEDVVDVQGRLSRQGSILTMTIASEDVQTYASWWQKALAVFAAGAVGLAIEAGGLYIGVPANVVSGLATFFLVLTYNEIVMAIDGKFLDPVEQREAVVNSLAWGLSTTGVASIKGLAWFQNLVQRAPGALFRAGGEIEHISEPIGHELQRFSHELQGIVENVEGFAEEVEAALGQITANSTNVVTIMPLGDSITYGIGDSDGNGYRDHLQSYLSGRTLQVSDFMGSNPNGTMEDPDNNGYPGWEIDQIAGPAANDIPWMQPDIVTIMAGTNDMIHNYDVTHAIDRLQRLINQILADMPDGFIVVATLTQCADPTINARILSYNDQVRDVIGARVARGERIELVDMTSVVPTAGWPDFVHPDDASYKQMAYEFQKGIGQGIARGLLPFVTITEDTYTAPLSGAQGDISSDGTQGDVSGLLDPDIAGGVTTLGPNPLNDVAQWEGLGTLASGTGDSPSNIRLLDFDGDGDDDYGIFNSDGSLTVWRNNGGDVSGGSGWSYIGKVALGTGDSTPVRFFDFDGDGDDDWGTLGTDGALKVWRNDGGDVGGNGWSYLGKVALGAGPGSRVRFLNFDKDGKADYGVFNADGSLTVWRNNGGDIPGGSGWYSLGQVARGTGDPAAVRFMDLDGDGDDDWIVVGTKGDLLAWRNDGGDSTEDGWTPLGLIAEGTGDGRVVRFMRADNDNDYDYVTVASNGGLTLWRNRMPTVAGELGNTVDGDIGSGNTNIDWSSYQLNDVFHWQGKGQLAAGAAPAANVRFLNFDNDGKPDYGVFSSDGSLTVWRNNGGDISGGSGWGYLGKVALGTGDPANVRFFDADGDGDDDWGRFNDDGSLTAWQNNGGDIAGGSGWGYMGEVAAGTGSAADVRFFDFDGDGDDDWGKFNSDGSMSVWRNNLNNTSTPLTNGWIAFGKIAGGTGDPNAVRLADLDGDSRGDWIVLGPQGQMLVWLNRGGDPNSTRPDIDANAGGWLPLGLVAEGTGDGSVVRFMDADGDGRSDYVTVAPGTGAIDLWRNDWN